MSDVVIRARDLRKVYRLYRKPSYRFLDMFGLLPGRAGGYAEHAALDGVSLDITRGEKVAIIGRNGAGKSTFLKLVTRVIEPTSGLLEVEGKVHALLQIGTGFHPDFTGRENVYAYLAQVGISGDLAREKCAEITEFAELEEYIDQPVKTYSTGMGVRLMFATSTAISPDLLVLDEVLGVGDAYFSHKSYDRMRALCDTAGSTLLLVTHDIYGAVKLCPRVVWIDQGRVLMDGEAGTVVKAYEDSIRQQEEQRLRTKKLQRLSELRGGPPGADGSARDVLLEVRARNNTPQPGSVHISRIDLLVDGQVVTTVPLDGQSADGSHVELDATCWGQPAERDGRMTRPFENFGSAFHRIAAVLDRGAAPAPRERTAVRIEYLSPEPCDLVWRAFVDGEEVDLGSLPASHDNWVTHVAPLSGSAAENTSLADLSITGRHGTGAIAVRDVQTTTDDGREAHQFKHGEPFNVWVHYQINQPGLREHAQVLVALHRDGIVDTCRILTRELLFDQGARSRGVVRLRLPRLYLAAGTFTLTVMVAQEGYYDRQQTKYFSLNPEVYTCWSRVTEIVVTDGGIVGTGTGVVGDGEWTLLDAPPAASERTAAELRDGHEARLG